MDKQNYLYLPGKLTLDANVVKKSRPAHIYKPLGQMANCNT